MGGSHLDHIELRRAADADGEPGGWAELADLRTDLSMEATDSHSAYAIDTPGTSKWWYGLRAVDQAGNVGNEEVPVLVVITDVLYVTESGQGDNLDAVGAWVTVPDDPEHAATIEQFNDPSNWSDQDSADGKIGPGDFVFFDGEFTTKPIVPMGGAPDRHVILDGYAAGDCDPTLVECSDSAHFFDGFALDGNVSHVTVQDIRSTDQSGSINYDQALSVWYGEAGERNEGLVFRRNYFHDSGARIVVFSQGDGERVRNVLFENNKVLNYGLHEPDCHAGFTFSGVDSVIIRNNIIGHDGPRRETSDNVMDWHDCN